jgi:hypothetical protein
MSVVYVFFETTGSIDSFSLTANLIPADLGDRIRKDIPFQEWDIQYNTGRKLPFLNIDLDTISWIARTSGRTRR